MHPPAAAVAVAQPAAALALAAAAVAALALATAAVPIAAATLASPPSPPSNPPVPPLPPPPAEPELARLNGTAAALVSSGGDDFAPWMLLPLLLLLGLPLGLAAAAKKKKKKFGSSKLMNQPSYAGDGETEAAKRRNEDAMAADPAYTLEDDHGAGLPDGWTEHTDDQGTPYFVHGPTGVSQWEPPMHTEGTAAAARRLEDHVLMQGIDMPLSSVHKPPGDMYSDLAALGRRQDSLPNTRKKRLKSTAAEQLPFVQALNVDDAAVQMQKAAEEAQAVARLNRAAAHEEISSEEIAALCSHVSATLADDEDVGQLMPLGAFGGHLAAAASGSVLLAKYLAAVDPESLDLRALNRVAQEHRGALSPEQRMQNHTLVVNALAANGCGLPDLQPEQLEEAAANTEVCCRRSTAQ